MITSDFQFPSGYQFTRTGIRRFSPLWPLQAIWT